MWIPDAFDGAWRHEVRRRFFGGPPEVRAAILTPIDGCFRELCSVRRARQLSGGWWRSAYRDGDLIALVPQGTPVLDAVSALEPGTSITFIGLAGSLGAWKIGDVVEAGSAWIDGRRFDRSFDTSPVFPRAEIATVCCLAESYQRCDELRGAVTAVDLETGFVYAAAKRQRKPARSFQVISDEVPVRSFVAVEPSLFLEGVRCAARAASPS